MEARQKVTVDVNFTIDEIESLMCILDKVMEQQSTAGLVKYKLEITDDEQALIDGLFLLFPQKPQAQVSQNIDQSNAAPAHEVIDDE